MNAISLKAGDKIRVIAPSMSKHPHETRYGYAEKLLTKKGYKVDYGKYVKNLDFLGTATVEQRLEDLHDAYKDPGVKLVLTLNGGWSTNELLPLINWQTIIDNPKPIVGYSDNTVLISAIQAMTGQITYMGPHFGTLGYKRGQEFTLKNLLTAIENDSFQIEPSKNWADLYSSKVKRTKWYVINPGSAEGMILGGNAGSYYLLQGTKYMPKFTQPFVLVYEDDALAGDWTIIEFDRRLESLLQQPDVRKNLKGLLIGRFQKDAQIRMSELEKVIKRKNLQNIPVLANMDFGHTLPMVTLPIGGNIRLTVNHKSISVQVVQ